MADSQNKYLQNSWWQDYLKMLQAAQPSNMQMQMLASKPNTALGLSAGNFLGALLGHALYPKRDGENMGVNEDSANALAYDSAVNKTNDALQNFAQQNPENPLSQQINLQNQPNTSDMSFGIDVNNLYPQSGVDKLREMQHNYNQSIGKPTSALNMTDNELKLLAEKLGFGR